MYWIALRILYVRPVGFSLTSPRPVQSRDTVLTLKTSAVCPLNPFFSEQNVWIKANYFLWEISYPILRSPFLDL